MVEELDKAIGTLEDYNYYVGRNESDPNKKIPIAYEEYKKAYKKVMKYLKILEILENSFHDFDSDYFYTSCTFEVRTNDFDGNETDEHKTIEEWIQNDCISKRL